MPLDGLAKQLMRVLSTLRANAIVVEQIREEVKAVHELVAVVPNMSDFRRLERSVDERRADGKAIKKVVGDHSRELAQLDSRVSALEAG